MTHKQFRERLEKELDNMGIPSRLEERVQIFAKLLKIPKFKAEALINGITLPDETLLAKIASELEVSPEWLIGKCNDR